MKIPENQLFVSHFLSIVSTTNSHYQDACEPPNEDDFREGARKQQIVLELDMDTWQVNVACICLFLVTFF
jgi:hypothetical protein